MNPREHAPRTQRAILCISATIGLLIAMSAPAVAAPDTSDEEIVCVRVDPSQPSIGVYRCSNLPRIEVVIDQATFEVEHPIEASHEGADTPTAGW